MFGGTIMPRQTRNTVRAAALAALYVSLTYTQELLLPGSASWVSQCRLSEALCVLALFTPAAIPGLSIGCLLFNLSAAGTLPLDFLVGTLATALGCGLMRLTRNVTIGGYPLLALTMPALTNGLLVGWELTIYLGSGSFAPAVFWANAGSVALGELAVLLIPGSLLWQAIRGRHLDETLFF